MTEFQHVYEAGVDPRSLSITSCNSRGNRRLMSPTAGAHRVTWDLTNSKTSHKIKQNDTATKLLAASSEEDVSLAPLKNETSSEYENNNHNDRAIEEYQIENAETLSNKDNEVPGIIGPLIEEESYSSDKEIHTDILDAEDQNKSVTEVTCNESRDEKEVLSRLLIIFYSLLVATCCITVQWGSNY